MLDEEKNSDNIPSARLAAGAEIARLIDEKYSSRKEFAGKIDLTEKKLSDLVHGRKKMDASLAKKLSEEFDIAPKYFLDLEQTFREKEKSSTKLAEDNADLGDEENTPSVHSQSVPLEKFTFSGVTMELVAGTSPERIKALADIFRQ